MYYQPINIDDSNLIVNSACGGQKAYAGEYYISFDWYLRSPILVCVYQRKCMIQLNVILAYEV